MELNQIIEWAGNSIYAFQALGALVGGTLCVILFRQLATKRFRTHKEAEEFREECSQWIRDHNWEALIARCDASPWWTKVSPQLLGLAASRTDIPPAEIRNFALDQFEREVQAELEHKVMWVNTVIKSAPMLGLLGTVAGMIAAFGKIASMQKSGTDPSMLANDISLALITTAVGLVIAVPLMIAISAILIRVRKLQFEVDQILTPLLDQLAEARFAETQQKVRTSSSERQVERTR
ncbi:MotA/TolQ/ExbB proton channel [Planctopirus limnophila DSM 3776]|uniref:MotA/TolQ/ExbB proton channel n=1 Tax=Planctopirus limnophila (strain ATCC 43296 / DSM 3776 / IFAM 1008 / Mu 290) TaxID=521674 RepID=D5SXF9_PLAL2|nr:MotA/TolQ/ExbB proton channel family protein [Planctopirus limnophila]ADG67526.1 MotA/TolQ/ExbB proton channel [Planctopirus limnophila DSM 3776]